MVCGQLEHYMSINNVNICKTKQQIKELILCISDFIATFVFEKSYLKATHSKVQK